MPRVKSSIELDTEIEAIRKKLAVKQKEVRAARRREKAAAEQVRAYEEDRFNREFVEKSREIRLSEYGGDDRTVYELVRSLIRPLVPPEPVEKEDLDLISLTGYDATAGLGLVEIMRRNSIL